MLSRNIICNTSYLLMLNSPAAPTVNVMDSHPPLHFVIPLLGLTRSSPRPLIPFQLPSLVDAVIHHYETSGRKEERKTDISCDRGAK